MKKWYFVLVVACLISCTNSHDKVQELERANASKEATIDSLQKVLAGTEMRVTEPDEQENFSSFPVTAKLYDKIGSSEIKDFEFAEVLAIAEADTAFGSNDYEVRVYLACNGPADPDIDECNCSHYAYVTTGTYDMPNDYKLFKVGPFFMPKFSKWGGTKEQPELTIEHQVKGKAEKTIIKVLNFERITLGNKS
jgi:hypothetical protein